MVVPMARPIGDGGVSTISKAAGRKASSSCARRFRATEKGMTFPVTSLTALADLMDATLQPVEPRVPSARMYQLVVSTIFDETPTVERHDAVGKPNGR